MSHEHQLGFLVFSSCARFNYSLSVSVEVQIVIIFKAVKLTR